MPSENREKGQKQTVRLSAEEMAALDESIELAKTGERWTWAEVKELARSRDKTVADIPKKRSA